MKVLPYDNSYANILLFFFPYIFGPPPSLSQVLIMSFDIVCHYVYMHTQHVSCHTKCLVMLDQSPITILDTGTSDLSPWQHIDRIVM